VYTASSAAIPAGTLTVTDVGCVICGSGPPTPKVVWQITSGTTADTVAAGSADVAGTEDGATAECEDGAGAVELTAGEHAATSSASATDASGTLGQDDRRVMAALLPPDMPGIKDERRRHAARWRTCCTAGDFASIILSMLLSVSWLGGDR
jgi:hypothetical protein